MDLVNSVNLLVNGRLVTVAVTKVMYQSSDRTEPAGGIVENSDGTLQIIVDARLPEQDQNSFLQDAMAEATKRLTRKLMN